MNLIRDFQYTNKLFQEQKLKRENTGQGSIDSTFKVEDSAVNVSVDCYPPITGETPIFQDKIRLVQ